MNKKLLLLDLDGTVRRTKSGETFINNPHDQEIIPEALKQITAFHRADYLIRGVTNQGGVHHGFKTIDQCVEEQKITLRSLNNMMDEIYFCPDQGDTCYYVTLDMAFASKFTAPLDINYRKPNAGMLKFAMDEYHPDYFIHCLYVGDRSEDREAASNAGIKFLTEKEWYRAHPI